MASDVATTGTDNITQTTGVDTLTVTDTNEIQATDFFDGGADNDEIVVGTAGAGASIDFSAAGTDATHGFHNYEGIAFANTSGTSTATFKASQFGAGLISNSLVVTGTASAQSIIINNAANFSAAAWTFFGWTSGIDTIVINGTSGNDAITGSSQADTISTGSGNDTLNGGAGADTLIGGLGNDTYNVDNAADQVKENAGEGTDTVLASASNYTLAVNVENLTYVGLGNFSGVGNSLSNVIIGGAGDDTIVDDLGNDNISGGAGNDSISAGAGGDIVRGGNGNDTVDGGDGANNLYGENGNDTLIGGIDNDLLNGGAGIDSMAGGAGNDTYYVDDSGDLAIEGASAGTDLVNSTVALFDLSVDAPNVENLNIFIGAPAGAIAIGNSLPNQMAVLSTLGGILSGLGGNDTLTSGAGNDQLFGGTENDRLIWNAGGGNDLLEGGDGTDTAEVIGGNGAETFTATANGTRVRFDRLIPAPSSLDIGTTENLVVNMNGGDDAFSASGNLAALIKITVDGGAGNDIILGSNGADFLLGGNDNDFIDGNQGNDVALLGSGNDIFQWDPGDGSDIVEGQAGTDTLLFNGANIAEHITISPNGGRVIFTRDIANIFMDLDDVETIHFNALGGADTITINDLSGTDVTNVEINLAAGGGGGDGAVDTVIFTGNVGENVTILPGSVIVMGLSATVTVDNAEAADKLVFGTGNDVISAAALPAGSIVPTIDGGDGNDNIIGSSSADILRGGVGNDSLTGGPGDDQVFGDAGNDRMIWNPGDGTDLFEGGDDIDTAEVNGGNGAETFTATANGTRVRFDRVSPAPSSLDIGTTENLVVNMNGGDDAFSASGNLAALIKITVDGGAGNDIILGSNGVDFLLGGDDNDFIDGNQGNDVALLGSGNDIFQWDPGDGSDIVEGQAGTDTLLFNGANIAEHITISPNGGRVIFTRDIANIFMDLDDVETIHFNALGGADTITINDLSGTDVTNVEINLAAGGGGGDGAVDTVIFTGNVGENVTILPGSVIVMGLSATVTVDNAEAADKLVFGTGNDVISAAALPAGSIVPTIDGGDGNDNIIGSSSADILRGGVGNDSLTGGPGDDQVFGDAGNDRMIWNPGDGTDLFEGGDDIDTAEVNGGNGAETFTATANGTRVRFDRVSPAPSSLDIGTTENLVVNMNGGDDAFSASGNLAALIKITVDGGAGNDIILGSNGVDFLLGGDDNDFIDGNQGNDVALLGSGNDIFQWDPGDGSDIVEGQAGTDTLLFNGANIAEHITISPNGGRVIFTRDVANVAMDLDDVETIHFNALGGADIITVNDLSGTDVTNVEINLAAGGGGDGAVDTVIVNATNGDDVIVVSGDANSVTISGLAATVTVLFLEATDRIVINGLAGADVVDASELAAGLLFEAHGGTGDDILIGGNGNDSLFGDDNDDVLIGGPGIDVLDGGAGNNVLLQ